MSNSNQTPVVAPATKSIQSIVFSTAWEIFKEGKEKGIAFRNALKAAWLIVRTKQEKEVTFSFVKESGELREAVSCYVKLDERVSGMLLFIDKVKGVFRRAKISQLFFQ